MPRRTRTGADPVDVIVGDRLRLRRKALGLSQGAVGAGLGMTFQQVQKYEKGSSVIGASRLQHLSELLSVPVAYFFEGAGAEKALDSVVSVLQTKQEMELLKAFAGIDNSRIRSRVIDLVKALAKPGTGVDGDADR